MDDLISRQAAIDAVAKALGEGSDLLTDTFIDGIREVLSNVPSAERKKGRWIETDDGWDGVYYECSCCKEAFTLIDGTPTDNLYNYCPNCGAEMRGEEE